MLQARLDLLSAYKAGGTFLDVGAGKGEFLALARGKGWTVEGIEPCPSFRRYARDRYGIECHAGYLGDSASLPEHSFDAITFNHVLEHVERPQRLLDTSRRYLKTGGVVFIEVPNCDSYFLRMADLYFRMKGLDWSSRLSPFHPPFHRFRFTGRSLTLLLEQSGFRVLHATTFSGKDRGCRRRKSRWHPEIVLRDLATASVKFLGNRELLAVVAKPMTSQGGE
jgi:SAM-dependent methyltransferase